jgi:hypothetical protein
VFVGGCDIYVHILPIFHPTITAAAAAVEEEAQAEGE